jgi:micrococcal nuclease
MRWPVVAALLLTAACGRASATVPTTAPLGVMAANATIEYVVDGDTVDVIIGDQQERVRLIGIDTPEIAHQGQPEPAECFGDEATTFTKSLVPVGTPVRLERDIVARDDYGRLLGYLYRASDGVFVNYEIVRQGYAQPLTIPPNVAFSELIVQAARDAEADQAGLWSACRS